MSQENPGALSFLQARTLVDGEQVQLHRLKHGRRWLRCWWYWCCYWCWGQTGGDCWAISSRLVGAAVDCVAHDACVWCDMGVDGWNRWLLG